MKLEIVDAKFINTEGLIEISYRTNKRKLGKLYAKFVKSSYNCMNCPVFGRCSGSFDALCNRIFMNPMIQELHRRLSIIMGSSAGFLVLTGKNGKA